MSFTPIAYFNAYNGVDYDYITVLVDVQTNEVIALNYDLSYYAYENIYDYLPQGGELSSYINPIDGLEYKIYAGNNPLIYPGGMTQPFAYVGLVAGSCDIAFLSIFTTDETIALNDGKISASATGSYSGIEFSIDGVTYFSSGNFTGLAPGTYTVYAKDSNGCIINNSAVILPYGGGPAVYGERYYIEYSSVMNDNNLFKVSFKQSGWTGGTTRLKAGKSPCVKQYLNNNEDKYEPIITSLLNLSLINDGTFIMSEFYSNDEREWKVDQYFNGVLDWQGWIIPDEIQDFYKDTTYEVSLTATDGLESLKGFQYLDANSYPILGKLKLTEILQFCLAKLDYLATKRIICSIVSDLDSGSDYQYPNTYLWSDAFYDQDLNAFDCNQVISEICKTFGWTLKQVGGNFIFSLANDLLKTTGGRIITEYDEDFVFINESTNYPVLKTIGIGMDYLPVNPVQNVTYDKALPKVSVTHDFGNYSIVNTNRSFEVGAVEDGHPPGWTFTVIGPPGYNTYKLKQVTYAYSGSWVFRASGNSYSGPPMSVGTIAVSPAIPITKTGQKVSVGLSYLAVSPITQGVPRGLIYIQFIRTSDSKVFDLFSDGKWYPDPPPAGVVPSGVTGYQELQSQYKDEWNNFTSPDSIDKTTAYTNEIPGIGNIYIWLNNINAYDLSGNILPTGPDAAMAYIDYDDLDITIAPIDDRNNPLVGETWNIINKTKVFLGQPRGIDSILYDQPNNEFLNGNIFFNDTITNKWSVINQPYAEASIGKILPIEIQANYQRPAVTWDGDIIADDVNMSMVFEIYGYSIKKFMPISMSHDQRAGITTIQVKEIIDDTLIFDFQYIPKYSRNSRTIIS